MFNLLLFTRGMERKVVEREVHSQNINSRVAKHPELRSMRVRVEQSKHLLFRNPSSDRNTLRLNPRIGDRKVRVQARARRSHSVHGDGIGRAAAVLLPISLNTAGDGIDQ